MPYPIHAWKINRPDLAMLFAESTISRITNAASELPIGDWLLQFFIVL